MSQVELGIDPVFGNVPVAVKPAPMPEPVAVALVPDFDPADFRFSD